MARNILFVTLTSALLIAGCAELSSLQAWNLIRPFALVLLGASHGAWLWLERRQLRWSTAGALLGPVAICAHWVSRHGSDAWPRGLAYLGLLSSTLIVAQGVVERFGGWPPST